MPVTPRTFLPGDQNYVITSIDGCKADLGSKKTVFRGVLAITYWAVPLN
jgi:hypothetical protein